MSAINSTLYSTTCRELNNPYKMLTEAIDQADNKIKSFGFDSIGIDINSLIEGSSERKVTCYFKVNADLFYQGEFSLTTLSVDELSLELINHATAIIMSKAAQAARLAQQISGKTFKLIPAEKLKEPKPERIVFLGEVAGQDTPRLFSIPFKTIVQHEPVAIAKTLEWNISKI